MTSAAYGQIVATSASPGPATTNGIEYHGGPIIANPNVYFIWYGNWSGNSALSILPQFVSGLSGSIYFSTDSLYSDSTGATVSNRVVMGNQVFDNYSQGASLTDQGVQAVVTQQLQNGSLPTDRRSSAVSFCFRAARAELPLKKSHSCIVMFFSIPNLELSKVPKSISSLLTIQQPIHNPLVQIPWHAKTMIPPEA